MIGVPGLTRWIWALTAVLVLAGGASAQTAHRYALLIGIDDYDGTGCTNLEGAMNDVRLMRDLLQSPRFGFQAGDVTVLDNSKATHQAVVAAIKDLAAKVGPQDLVYIHYSGHGSRTCDLNGDEAGRSGLDSTLVTYGSRSGLKAPPTAKTQCDPSKAADAQAAVQTDLNDFDLLDDELGELLGALSARCGHVVFVSDSCHSGTITRGAGALKTRGAGLDPRAHPLGFRSYGKPAGTWLTVSAARDEEPAMEYKDPKSGGNQGAFTWFWAKSLESAGPSDTWQDVFKRASAMLSNEGYPQQPQFDGDVAVTVLGGSGGTSRSTYPVQYVSSDGGTATIEAGSILGVTAGSVFRKADQAPGSGDTVTIESLSATRAKGKIRGNVKSGDLLVLDTYMPPVKRMRVFLRADLPGDAAVLERLREALGRLPAVEAVDSQADSDMVLWVLRPGGEETREYLQSPAGGALPASSPDNPAQCWMLTPGEHFYGGRTQLRFGVDQTGLDAIRENLEKIVRLRGMLDLPPPPGQAAPYEVKARIYAPSAEAGQAQAGCGEAKLIGGRSYKLVKTVSLADLAGYDRPSGEAMVFFEIDNRADGAYWFYIINFTPDGHILPLPLEGETLNPFDPLYRVKAGEAKQFCDGGLQLTEDVEYVRVLASKAPVDVRVLEQQSFKGGLRGADTLDPLAQLLAGSVGLAPSRGASIQAQKPGEWSSVLGSFKTR